MQEFSLDQPTNPSQLVGLLEKANVPKVQFEKDMVIFREGSKGDQAFFIAAGGVKILKKSDSGADKLLDILKSGVIFGEMALLFSEPRSATVTAQEETEVFCLASEDFRRIVSLSPDMTERLRALAENRRRELAQS